MTNDAKHSYFLSKTLAVHMMRFSTQALTTQSCTIYGETSRLAFHHKVYACSWSVKNGTCNSEKKKKEMLIHFLTKTDINSVPSIKASLLMVNLLRE